MPFKLSRYHQAILAIYIFLVPFFIVFNQQQLDYRFSLLHLDWVIIILAVTFFFFFSATHKLVVKRSSQSLKHIGLASLYALLFALPEEIIFRGIVLSYFQTHISNIILAVVFSAAIYGAAHLLNGAKKYNFSNLNWSLAIRTFFLGLPLGALFVLTKSLLIPVLLHAFVIAYLKLYLKKN